jgi:AraC-like DNA-binding protein
MEAHSRKATEKLQNLISHVWFMEFKENEKVERTDLIMPTGSLNMVFNYADEQYLIHEKGEPEKLPDILITGQLNKVWKLQYGDTLKQFGIILKPIGFFRLFKVPAALFSGTFIDGETAPWNLEKLYSELSQHHDVNKAFDFIEEYLQTHTNPEDVPAFLTEILNSIELSEGNISTDELASTYHKSVSSIERYFKKMVGMTPKAYSNIVKFNTAINVMDEANNILDYYYDQSHFIKTCKKYTGKTPAELMKTNKEISLNYMLKER